VVALPVILNLRATGITFEEPVRFLEVLGLSIALVGLAMETLADEQLRRFKLKGVSGGICSVGLWSVSRHPNYLGEALVWWGLSLTALGWPQGWLALASPILLTYLLLKVSGVAMLELSMSRRPGWAEYAEKTAPFVPWIRWIR
jgi:steroid 5-alpha reductase family enzyme